jgi:hypothetical protein
MGGPLTFQTVNDKGYLIELDLDLPGISNKKPSDRKELIETFVTMRQTFEGSFDNDDLYIVGPWLDESFITFLNSRNSQFIELQRVPLPKPGTYISPMPGSVVLHKRKGQPDTYIWGNPGCGPLFDDLKTSKDAISAVNPDYLVPKDLVAFQVVRKKTYSKIYDDTEMIDLLTLILRINCRFRHFALPSAPKGPATKGSAKDAHPFREYHYTLLGLFAYQCFTYIRNMFAVRDIPFCWTTVKSLLNTQTLTLDSQPGKPANPSFGPPNEHLKKLYKLFDMFERPFIKPSLADMGMEDIKIASSNETDVVIRTIMARHFGKKISKVPKKAVPDTKITIIDYSDSQPPKAKAAPAPKAKAAPAPTAKPAPAPKAKAAPAPKAKAAPAPKAKPAPAPKAKAAPAPKAKPAPATKAKATPAPKAKAAPAPKAKATPAPEAKATPAPKAKAKTDGSAKTSGKGGKKTK